MVYVDKEYDFVVLELNVYDFGVLFFLVLICFGKVDLFDVYFVGYFNCM